jgi:ribosomal protein L7/L12
VIDLIGLVQMLVDCRDAAVRKHLAIALREQIKLDYLTPPPAKPKLTDLEISLGENQSKIAVVKAIRERLGYGLVEAKQFAESEFERLGKTFYQNWPS